MNNYRISLLQIDSGYMITIIKAFQTDTSMLKFLFEDDIIALEPSYTYPVIHQFISENVPILIR